MSYFSVKNYEQFQHYKDRSPPWIKFYNSVLDDYEFTRLPDAARFHLVAIWLLASRTDNRIPNDPEWVRQAIKANVAVDMTALFNAGFLIEYKRKGCKRRASKTIDQSRAEREHIEQQSRAEAPAAFENGKGKPVSKEAKAIARKLAEMFGGDPESKSWSAAYVDVWLVEGHTEAQIMEAAESIRAREPQPEVGSIKYFAPMLSDSEGAPVTIANHLSRLPPKGMRDCTTAEYMTYMREQYGEKFDEAHIKYRRNQFVPKEWSPNVVQMRKAVS